MWRALFYICTVCLIFVAGNECLGAESGQANSEETVASYTEKVLAIDRRLGHSLSTPSVLDNPLFDDLASHGAENIDNCIAFLSSRPRTAQQRMIAILSMYKLSLNDYLRFMEGVSGIIRHIYFTRHEVNLAIGMEYSQTVLIENYEDKRVQKVLKSIAEKSIDPEVKADIEAVLSGKVWRGILQTRRDRDWDGFMQWLSYYVKGWQLLAAGALLATIYGVVRLRKAKKI